MADKVVDSLRKKERNGVICLHDLFDCGERVAIVGSGLFAGCKGIYVGMKGHDRCSVMLSMLGQQVPIDMEMKYIRAAA